MYDFIIENFNASFTFSFTHEIWVSHDFEQKIFLSLNFLKITTLNHLFIDNAALYKNKIYHS